MPRRALALGLVFILSLILSPILGPIPAAAQSADPFMGNYRGGFTGGPHGNEKLSAQISALGRGAYRVVVYLRGGPGEGRRAEFRGQVAEGVLDIEAASATTPDVGYTLGGSIEAEVFRGFLKEDGNVTSFKLERVVIESPTLGMQPPEGAEVLLDGSNLDKWIVRPRWVINGAGAMAISGGSIMTKEAFGDAQYHIEFRTPFMPTARGQARGNSGVYAMGAYEIQVLDSFADVPADNLCGGIYQFATPIVNACAPPGQWQTYDITMRAPRFGPDGKKTENAVLTVKLNGVTIHDNLVLEHASPGGLGNTEVPEGRLMIQDHGDGVQFRNIWVDLWVDALD